VPGGADLPRGAGYPGEHANNQETGPIEARELTLQLADLIDERQGEDIVILDVSGPLAIADYFLIATARNSRHARALAREVAQTAKALGARHRHTAGLEGESQWVLLDLGEIVVHLLQPKQRDFYALEALWSDVPRVAFEPSERPAGAAHPTADSGGFSERDWSHGLDDR